jgi:hypothetical protein
MAQSVFDEKRGWRKTYFPSAAQFIKDEKNMIAWRLKKKELTTCQRLKTAWA